MEGYPKRSSRPESSDKKQRSWRELLPLALAGVLSVAAMTESWTPSVEREESYSSDWDRLRSETPFDLEGLADVANARLEVPGTKYIFHIAQMHGGGSLEATKKVYEADGLSVDQLVECQKQIATVIDYLSTTYGVSTIYEEGLSDADEAYYKSLFDGLANNPKTTGQKIYNEWLDDQGKHVPSFFDEYRARDLIAGAKALRGTPEGDALAKDPLIAGDTKYIWGAPFVLATEGDITIAPGEDTEANGQATLLGNTAIDGITSPQGKAIREAAAVALVKKGQEDSNAPAALVYGLAHDFADDVQSLNAHGADIGLIRIDPKACFK